MDIPATGSMPGTMHHWPFKHCCRSYYLGRQAIEPDTWPPRIQVGSVLRGSSVTVPHELGFDISHVETLAAGIPAEHTTANMRAHKQWIFGV